MEWWLSGKHGSLPPTVAIAVDGALVRPDGRLGKGGGGFTTCKSAPDEGAVDNLEDDMDDRLESLGLDAGMIKDRFLILVALVLGKC